MKFWRGQRDERMTRFFKTAAICVLSCCLCFSGCGADKRDRNPEVQSGEGLGSVGESVQSPHPVDPEEQLRVPMPAQIVPEGRQVVTLGTFGAVNAESPMYQAVNAFNKAQERYFVSIEVYGSYDHFLLDIARKQGTDLYNLFLGVSGDLLVAQGVLEDLTPYFERSSAVNREDIVDAVWRAGSVDDKLYFLFPSFCCYGILVEKGHTKDGAWSGRDYIELGKKNPGCMLNAQIKNPTAQILSELREYMAAFIDWDNRSCSFDSDEFIALLKDLKALSDYSYEAVDKDATRAELIRGKTYLSMNVAIVMSMGMSTYLDIQEAFGDSYEIAGYPTADGSLQYEMGFNSQQYGMNAGAKNKEGAWAFLEYLVSEEYQQPMPPNYIQGYSSPIGMMFPVRKDSLERGLQANVDYVAGPDDYYTHSTNPYTKERREDGYKGFTEEDKQAVLRIIDNSYRSVFETDFTLLSIWSEEVEPFFKGQKSAEEVADILQSIVSLYLIE